MNRSYRDSRYGRTDPDGPGTVRIGLDRIRGLSAAGAHRIVAVRSSRGGFDNLAGFILRTGLSRSDIRGLILSGACDRLFPLSPDDYPFAHEAALELLRRTNNPHDLDRLAIPRPEGSSAQKVSLFRALVRVKTSFSILVCT